MNDFVSAEITIRDTLADAARRLGALSDCARLDAELLLARALDVPRSYLIAHPEDCPDAAAQARFAAALEERERGVPLAYIVGEKEFWSLSLMVSRATLVPRPDTELLVEKALAVVPRNAVSSLLDLGTGSGAIALAIARERPLANITATDSSAAALAVAAQNARQLDTGNVSFVAGNWTAPVAGQRFDVIVSNPPYIRADDPALAALSHEPVNALVSGADGLDAVRQLARQCASVLANGGTLLLEHGADQRSAVASILSAAGWIDIRCFTDLAGLPRVTRAKLPG